MQNTTVHNRPLLPALLSAPLAILPTRIPSEIFARTLTQVLRRQLNEGLFSFMEHRVLVVNVEDARVVHRISLQNHRFCAASSQRPVDLSISGTVYDFLTLLAGREDPDSLFFQRRLKLLGDTEMGLHIKNLLDSLEPTTAQKILVSLFPQAIKLYEHIFTRH